jgi:hypothetical protein
MIHLLIGEIAAKNLQEAFLIDPNLEGEIVVLYDDLSVGPIQVTEDSNVDAIRYEFHRLTKGLTTPNIKEYSRLREVISNAEQEEEPICLWMAPNVQDTCYYYWLLSVCKNYQGMLHQIAIQGLPFLNEKGQLFYPESFAQIPPKEFVKTKRLLKEVTPADYEMDGDEWNRLKNESTWVRVLESGKKVVSKNIDYYDATIQSSISNDFQKASKIVQECCKKIDSNVSPSFIEWRLRQMLQDETLSVQGDSTKALKDFEIKKWNTVIANEEEIN